MPTLLAWDVWPQHRRSTGPVWPSCSHQPFLPPAPGPVSEPYGYTWPTQSTFFTRTISQIHQQEANVVMSMQTILASLLFQKPIVPITFQDWGFVLFFKVSALLRTGLFLSLMVSYFSSYAFSRQSFFTFRAEQDFTATLLSFRLGSTQSFLTIITTEKLQPTQRGKHKFCYDSFIRLILINIPQQASIQCFSRTATGDVSAGSIFGCSKYLMGMQGFQCSFTR